MPMIFCYGPCMIGEPEHRLLAGARFMGATRTAPKFTLINLVDFPALVEGGTTAVAGELYLVDPETLVRVDRLEGHPDFYRRQRIELESGGQAEAYVMPLGRAGPSTVIESGDWREGRRAAKLDW